LEVAWYPSRPTASVSSVAVLAAWSRSSVSAGSGADPRRVWRDVPEVSLQILLCTQDCPIAYCCADRPRNSVAAPET
jgi:hypothetical protein